MVTSVKVVIDLDGCLAYGELACCFLLFPLQIGLLCMCVIQRCKKISSSGEVRYQSESIVDISFVEIRELDFICWLFLDALTMISLEQCFKWLSAVVAFKAGGPDDIPNWVLHEFAVELVYSLFVWS